MIEMVGATLNSMSSPSMVDPLALNSVGFGHKPTEIRTKRSTIVEEDINLRVSPTKPIMLQWPND